MHKIINTFLRAYRDNREINKESTLKLAEENLKHSMRFTNRM